MYQLQFKSGRVLSTHATMEQARTALETRNDGLKYCTEAYIVGITGEEVVPDKPSVVPVILAAFDRATMAAYRFTHTESYCLDVSEYYIFFTDILELKDTLTLTRGN